MSTPQMSPELRNLTDRLRTAEFEKTVPFMYLDTVGKVTVGVGHNLTDNPEPNMTSLPFVVKRLERQAVKGGDKGIPITDNPTIGRSATPVEIQNDYDFLRRHQPLGHYSPENMGKYTTLELSTSGVDGLFDDDRNYFYFKCRKEFDSATFLSFPVTCQAALMDIAFNCGGFGSFRTHLIPAIKGVGIYTNKTWSERWAVAAQHCRRGAVGTQRNQIVAGWFTQGAQASIKETAAWLAIVITGDGLSVLECW